jgi:hypothetical protein
VTAFDSSVYPATFAAYRAEAVQEAAVIVRNGLHSLVPYWTADADGMVDPFDDPEVRAAIRRYITCRFDRGMRLKDMADPPTTSEVRA